MIKVENGNIDILKDYTNLKDNLEKVYEFKVKDTELVDCSVENMSINSHDALNENNFLDLVNEYLTKDTL